MAVARAVAASRGIQLREFKRPEARYRDDGGHGTWCFLFWNKDSRSPGNWFGVFVDDRTAQSEFILGR
jgi:hypothetical protein